MHNLTSNGRQFVLRVDLVAYDGQHIFAEYNNFSIAPESDNYRMFVSGYQQTSTAGKYYLKRGYLHIFNMMAFHMILITRFR